VLGAVAVLGAVDECERGGVGSIFAGVKKNRKVVFHKMKCGFKK